MDDKRFLKESEENGRFIVKSIKTGRKYYVETIGNEHDSDWGDLDPVTKKMSGGYGKRYVGCIKEKDSLITEENGFEKITTLPSGVSPFDEIDRRDREYEKNNLN